ncbi:MAG: 3-oxoacyl-ACP synthase [Gemmatimonadetes bacterium]|jgi:3-oxoacyl-[acyl-carrier-protein] synthase-3|nr:3-oxoacyl-ACP synthase [Gemmatimonadota bacterium]
MDDNRRVGILGAGYTVPANIRTNDDPIFDWLRQNTPPDQSLFVGYDRRHVLSPGETLDDIMIPAATRALDAAGVAARDIDLLLGYASVSEFIMPNALARVHHALNLPARCWILPLNNEYSNFNAAVVLATAMIESGRAANALIVCGGNWTQYVNYHTPQSVSAADGAGAAVVGRTADPSRFVVVDYENETQSGSYGVMYMQPDPITGTAATGAGTSAQPAFTRPYFHITQAGFEEFQQFGGNVPPQVVKRLLDRHGLTGSDITLIAHQTSAGLITLWKNAIQPALFLESLQTMANMTLASIPVNLACFYDRIQTPHLVLLGIGPELHTNAVLLRRDG